MARPKPTNIGIAAAATAWSMPAIVAAAMICPPVLLVIPAAGTVAAHRQTVKRHRRNATQAADAQYLKEAWDRWSRLDPTSERGY